MDWVKSILYHNPTSSIKRLFRTWLLVNSDLDDLIPNTPDILFTKNSNARDYLMNQYLLTRGWRRFVWKKGAPEKVEMKYAIEEGLMINGQMSQVKSPEKGQDGKVFLSIMQDNMFEDNDERAIFFAKGVVETVKKLNWAPDVIHVHGWLASLLPLYIKEYYKDDALFVNSKIITSVYNNAFAGTLNEQFADKIKFDNVNESKITSLASPSHSNFRPQERRLRGRDGQLQPRDRLDRLRHVRQPVLRAADC